MSETKMRIRDFMREVLSEGRAEASDRYIADGFVDHQPWPGHPGTLAGFKAGLVEFHEAFPDLRAEPQRIVEEGDSVVVLFEMSGTHLGPFMGAPASGKTFRVQGLDMIRLEKGKMVEHWGFFDTEALARQIGLSPG